MRTFVGETTWSDYSVAVDVMENTGDTSWGPGWFDAKIAVFIRVRDQNNMVGFFYRPGRPSGFRVMHAGTWKQEASGTAPGEYSAHLLITAAGSTYSAYANDNLIATFEDSTIAQGYVGLQAATFSAYAYGWRSPSFDNFRVTALR
jgi:hypothetical protein